MTTQCFIVNFYTGEYSDCSIEPLAVFTSKVDAEKFAAAKRLQLNEMGLHGEGDCSKANIYPRPNLDGLRIDYTGAWIHVSQSLPLDPSDRSDLNQKEGTMTETAEKYYIKYVGEAGVNYIPNTNLYWGGQYNSWMKTANEAHSYTKEEAFREIGRILCEREELSELVLEKDLPSPEKLETDRLIVDLKKEHYSIANSAISQREWMIEKCCSLWDKQKIGHEVFARAMYRIIHS